MDKEAADAQPPVARPPATSGPWPITVVSPPLWVRGIFFLPRSLPIRVALDLPLGLGYR